MDFTLSKHFFEALSAQEKAEIEEIIQEMTPQILAKLVDAKAEMGVQEEQKAQAFDLLIGIKGQLSWTQGLIRSWKPMPEDPQIAAKFPGIDPMGKYSVLELRAAERQTRIDVALQKCDPAVAEYVRGLQEQPVVKALREELAHASKKHRLLTRAARMGVDPDAKAFLLLAADQLGLSGAAVAYSQYLDGLEYLSGIKTGPVLQDVRQFFEEKLHAPLREELLPQGNEQQYIPQQFVVNFENLENQVQQMQLADPENWDKPMEDAEPVAEEAVVRLVDGYAGATANCLLESLFSKAEELGTGEEINRGDLIIIDGKTVRERIYEAYQARKGDLNAFDTYYKEHHKELTDDLVAAGLMADKRVEVFVPDKTGKIPQEPAQIVRTGYEPTSLQPVIMNAWERFWSKFGFYKEKTMQAAEYQRMAEARERVQVNNYLKRLELLGGDQPEMRGQFTAQIEAPEDQYGAFDISGSKLYSLGVCALLKDGYRLEDVFHPGKLQAEKAAAGAKIIRALGDDPDESERTLAMIMASGHGQMVRYLDGKAKQLDFADVHQLYRPENGLLFLVADAMHDITEMTAMSESVKAHYERFAEVTFGYSAMERGKAGYNGFAKGVSTYLRNVRQSLDNGVRMAGGLEMNRSAEDCLKPIVASQIDRIYLSGPSGKEALSWSLYPKEKEQTDIRSVMFAGHGCHLVQALDTNKEMRKTIGQQVLNGQLRERIQVVANQRGDLVMNLAPPSKQATQQAENARQLQETARQNERLAQQQKAKSMGGPAL